MKLKSKEQITELLRPFNEIGSFVDFTSPAGNKTRLIIDSLDVVRINPELNSDGNVPGMGKIQCDHRQQ